MKLSSCIRSKIESEQTCTQGSIPSCSEPFQKCPKGSCTRVPSLPKSHWDIWWGCTLCDFAHSCANSQKVQPMYSTDPNSTQFLSQSCSEPNPRGSYPGVTTWLASGQSSGGPLGDQDCDNFLSLKGLPAGSQIKRALPQSWQKMLVGLRIGEWLELVCCRSYSAVST